MPRRIVFDTNVVISALIFTRGSVAWLRDHWRENECTPISSTVTLHELIRVLSYSKFRLDEVKRIELLADYVPYCELIRDLQPCPVRCRDAADKAFLDLAHSGAADILVTGDGDLLSVASQTRFAIQTPTEYRLRLGTA